MNIFLTCGHDIDSDEDIVETSLKGYTIEDERCIDFVTICKSCYTTYKIDDLILYTEKDRERWINEEKVN